MKDSFKYDAIITDPPYGIREKAKKIGNKKSGNNSKELDELKDENSNDIQVIKIFGS